MAALHIDSTSALRHASFARPAQFVWKDCSARTRRPGLRDTKRRRTAVLATYSGREAIDTGREKFEEGDRVGALKQFEAAIRQPLSPQERREALYGTTAVHASFGDIEQAQMSLREGLEAGLDFEAALSDGDMIKWKSSPQVLSQLKKFARTLQQIREAVTPNSRSRAEVAAPAQDGIDYASGGGRLKKPNPNMSLSEMLTTDITGMDATVSGIVKRLLLLVVVGVVLGAALFYLGLEYAGIAH